MKSDDRSRKNIHGSLTEGGVFSTISRLAAPMLVSALLHNLQSLIDLFWVGRLGHTAIAGVAMGGTVITILFPGIMGLSTGAVAVVARAVGAGRPAAAAAAAAQSIGMAFWLGFRCLCCSWPTPRCRAPATPGRRC
ncbi:MAG: hypothetical protein LC725_11450 [Lentisphaerae bacterium]|nr:hypothetical protein [Lentisphaerota bacterium]